MSTPLKESLSPALIETVGRQIAAVHPGFDQAGFRAAAVDGLERLELKARVDHVGAALDDHLDLPYERAADVLCRAADDGDMGMWAAWPLATWIGKHGEEEPEAALEALGRITRHASAEFAVRSLIERHPRLAFTTFERWARGEDLHRRRLVSEGTRPRLPWGRRLRELQRDPSPCIELLDILRDDPEPYVRRSVANHLNDIAKDHPRLALDTARRWQQEGGENTAWVVRHGLRTMIKAGDPGALALVGIDTEAPLQVRDLRLADDTVMLGGALSFSFTLATSARRPVAVIVDYVVHHRKANGGSSPKVFKLVSCTLEPGVPREFRRRHPMRPITTRRYHAGAHRLEVQVNGRVLAAVPFTLALSRSG